jgi:mRNA interferase MazF
LIQPSVQKSAKLDQPLLSTTTELAFCHLQVIVPITDWKEIFATRPWMVCIQPSLENRLNKILGADTFQVRSVSENRLLKKLGKVDNDEMQQISEALALVLAI